MKILQFTFLLYFLTVINDTFSQIQQIDSLNNLYLKYQYNNLLKAEKLAREAVELSKIMNNDTLLLKSNNNLLSVLLKKRKIQELEEKAIENIELAKKINDQKYLCSAYSYLGNVYRRLREYDKSLTNLEKGLLIARNNNFKDLEHRLLNYKSVLFRRTKNNKKAKQILQSLIKNSTNKNIYTLTYSYNSLASLYNRFEKDKDSSAFFYLKAINLLEKSENYYLKSTLFLNYGILLLESNKQKQGLSYIEKAKTLAEVINNFTSLFFINNSLANYYLNKEDDEKAIELYEISLKRYIKYADGNQISDLYWILSGAYYNNKQYKEGFNIQEKLIYLKDSLFDIEKNKAFEELQTKFEVEKKNNQIAFLEKEQLLKAKEQKLVYSIGGLVFLGLVLVVFIFRYRIKSQKLIRKQEQQLFTNEKEKLEQEKELQSTKAYIDGQEKEKNRIALELHDGIVGDLVGLQHFVNNPNFETNTTYQEKTKEKLTQIAGEVRYLSHSLSSNYVDNTSFTTLIYKLVQPFINAKNLNISIHFFEEKDFEHLKNNLKNNLYRIIQQLLNNSIKHANANELNLSFTAHKDYYNIIFEDNGIGFDLEQQKFGIGLLNIKKRVQDLNGSLQIDTQPNKGTTIVMDIIRNE